ncbi:MULTISPECIES: IS481 family transposase [Bradyrhizobium]|uniref:Transposase InsO and inactivated derivatives n=2 Tax=Bradyrhizobium TaxID=374 RepID=A0ABY0PWW6_9BRAD|nr:MULTISPECIES: IS481 family transposase [Bradyrhizobium]SDI48308.1 Transposase InsO and inactivated derivatives [Bradyrhizobium ottawaense]SDJ08676.1 Transposase InsO and inactivated derivatives [Bradyrhizobium ottawaense]SEC94663.1 Transposase InsO and inactivated derivatives [Bradyrhizobium lablabi]SED48597.1 Transposase InsO and inactivated derivatives [Bradyrhizobium lablabi]SHL48346.1 Transposase InsO and inactivated derivatives [Bradyrhizobium lablabi]
MPWREVSVMDERHEFVRLAMQDGANRRELCRRFGIGPDVGYKWLRRWQAGDRDLVDRSRRPHVTPKRSEVATEARVLMVRDKHPAWGARKIAHCLKRDGMAVPVPSTVHQILCRNGRIKPTENAPPNPGHRFEKEAPNLLWQMDFKGHMPLTNGTDCHPLTMVDDHSRYVLCLKACANEQRLTVQDHLTATFRRYGLPDAFYTDNGSPWGDTSGVHWTGLKVWLLKLGVTVVHARPRHPQARGKNERFHRTLKDEVFAMRRFRNLPEVQQALDAWRIVYNLERPHEALGMDVPASRYRPSSRTMPDRLPKIEYDSREIVRTVSSTRHYISFKGRLWKVPQAFARERLAIRPLTREGLYGIFFASWQVASIDLTAGQGVSDVSEQVSAMSPG